MRHLTAARCGAREGNPPAPPAAHCAADNGSKGAGSEHGGARPPLGVQGRWLRPSARGAARALRGPAPGASRARRGHAVYDRPRPAALRPGCLNQRMPPPAPRPRPHSGSARGAQLHDGGVGVEPRGVPRGAAGGAGVPRVGGCAARVERRTACAQPHMRRLGPRVPAGGAAPRGTTARPRRCPRPRRRAARGRRGSLKRSGVGAIDRCGTPRRLRGSRLRPSGDGPRTPSLSTRWRRRRGGGVAGACLGPGSSAWLGCLHRRRRRGGRLPAAPGERGQGRGGRRASDARRGARGGVRGYHRRTARPLRGGLALGAPPAPRVFVSRPVGLCAQSEMRAPPFVATAAPIQRSRASLPARSARSPSPPSIDAFYLSIGSAPCTAQHDTAQHSTAQHSVVHRPRWCNLRAVAAAACWTRRSGAQGGARGAEAARFSSGTTREHDPPPPPYCCPYPCPYCTLTPTLPSRRRYCGTRWDAEGRRPRGRCTSCSTAPGRSRTAPPKSSPSTTTWCVPPARAPRAASWTGRAGGAESAHKAGAAPAACGAAARVLRAAPLCSGWLFRLERLSRPPRAKPPRLRARRLLWGSTLCAPFAPPCKPS